MITVACVEWGNYKERGAEYVAKLRSMVERNLDAAHAFVCLTDDPERHPDTFTRKLSPGRTGWWNKLELFRDGLFAPGTRVLYFDLDTIIVGPLDELARSKGLLHLDRWGWATKTYGSGVMSWTEGEHADAWLRMNDPPGPVMSRFEGDQDWLTALGGWDALPDGLCVSYRYHCQKQGLPPDGASVVCFHGSPKPHNALKNDAWWRERWQ